MSAETKIMLHHKIHYSGTSAESSPEHAKLTVSIWHEPYVMFLRKKSGPKCCLQCEMLIFCNEGCAD